MLSRKIKLYSHNNLNPILDIIIEEKINLLETKKIEILNINSITFTK